MPTLINERYEILELLGIGGEGRVVKALDRRHDRLVTLKIRPVRDDQAREELLSEARILLAVPPHPALPLVREDFFDGDDYVVAMDWVDGHRSGHAAARAGPTGAGALERARLPVAGGRGTDAPALADSAGHPRRREAGEPDPHHGRTGQAGRFRDLVGAERAAPPRRHSRLPGAGARSRWRPVASQRRLRARGHGVCAADRFRPSRCAAALGGNRSGTGRAVRGRDPARDGD